MHAQTIYKEHFPTHLNIPIQSNLDIIEQFLAMYVSVVLY